jgi:hypothetical protein
MSKLKKLWTRLEKGAIYATLLLFLILELLTKISPWASSFFIDNRGDILLIAIVLLFVFRYLDEKLKTLDEPPFQTSSTFLDRARTILWERRECNNVDIFAHTGLLFARAVFDSKVHIGNLRILLRDFHDLTKISLPADCSAKLQIQHEWKSTIQEWEQLKREGHIQNMSIQYYPFDPMMTFMIIDGSIAYFDLMKPQKTLPGSTSRYTPTCYIVTHGTDVGRQLIKDLSIDFDQIWNEFKD